TSRWHRAMTSMCVRGHDIPVVVRDAFVPRQLISTPIPMPCHVTNTKGVVPHPMALANALPTCAI
ncbi:hypothetical protein HAX54_030216, partial [Datura stramonium]|nr:hypothetical protein [Datura stramonium]